MENETIQNNKISKPDIQIQPQEAILPTTKYGRKFFGVLVLILISIFILGISSVLAYQAWRQKRPGTMNPTPTNPIVVSPTIVYPTIANPTIIIPVTITTQPPAIETNLKLYTVPDIFSFKYRENFEVNKIMDAPGISISLNVGQGTDKPAADIVMDLFWKNLENNQTLSDVVNRNEEEIKPRSDEKIVQSAIKVQYGTNSGYEIISSLYGKVKRYIYIQSPYKPTLYLQIIQNPNIVTGNSYTREVNEIVSSINFID